MLEHVVLSHSYQILYSLFFSHSSFILLYLSLSNFCGLIFKFIDSLLSCVKCTDEPCQTRNCEVSEILSYLQSNKLVYHCGIYTDRTQKLWAR